MLDALCSQLTKLYAVSGIMYKQTLDWPHEDHFQIDYSFLDQLLDIFIHFKGP